MPREQAKKEKRERKDTEPGKEEPLVSIGQVLGQRWRLRRRVGKGLLAAGFAGAGLVVGVFWFDRIAAGIYGRLKPSLERQIGSAMGRPLSLGPYRGLRPDGLWIGPSRFLAGQKDGSTASVEAARLRIDPLASLWLRGAVLDLGLQRARADLRRNSTGQFWVLGSVPPGR